MQIKGISIIICCYNSEQKLEATLNHLFKQETENDLNWEIILIDNASKDDTYNFTQHYFETHINQKIATQLLSESKAGKSHALIKGIENAHYSYLLICDDDNWLAPNYLQNAFNLMEKNPKIGILGGLCLPRVEIEEIPNWLPNYIGGYACGNPDQKAGEVNDVVGAGMVIRKEVITSIYANGFKSLLDCFRGKIITNGEDAEYCNMVKFANFQIWYSPTLILQHFIPKEKLSWKYCKNLFAGFAHSEVLLELYNLAIQNKYPNGLPSFYWLKKSAYYFLISIKYYPSYHSCLNKEGSSKGILMLSWKLKYKEYCKQNFKLEKHFKTILKLKHTLENTNLIV
jgi:glycosyltransferase involved in cell wall biosynthesis